LIDTLENVMSHDKRLQKAVLDALSWAPTVAAEHIGVTVDAGVVTLSGHVDSFAEKHAAEAVVAEVKGVKAIAEEIEVRLPFETERDDGEIAAAAIDRLFWDVSVPRKAVKVLVDKGWISLSGEVDWFFQKEAAEQDVRRLFGVTGVSNQIAIKPRANASNIGDAIQGAMDRSWLPDSASITVSVDDGRVRLSGEVHSSHDKKLAGVTAWSAPGVTYVTNDLVVN
jgi:osmotically-inducible protein OsmY